ncbi:MAG: pyruvate dehydrogenase complex dihydrolipoamide acetyltransferase [Planctomycetota bacterium]|nr:MAG: pyruvate dehydrogenase complex dihydrolipoamide acetyltransferase [Planctomycetota bacterium]
MPIEITMPRLSDTMETGTVITWNVKEGDAVSAGDTLADIETDKATMELQSYDDGVVAKILTPEGASVEVGTPIMILAEEGEDIADAAAGATISAAAAPPTQQATSARESGSPPAGAPAPTAVAAPPAPSAPSNGAAAPAGDGRVFASPLARKIAREKGVDLTRLRGTGPSNRITKRDVEAALTGAPPAPAPSAPASPAAGLATPLPGPTLEARVVPLSNMRRTIAARLVQSKQTVPHYQVTVAARMDALLALRRQLNEQLASQGVKLSVNDFIVRACALAMHEHPFVNSRWVESGPDGGPAIEILPHVNVGVAVALPPERGGGLVVATIHNADRSGLRSISQRTRDLAEKARAKGLSVEEMSDSTFTISNLGMFGVEHFTAIINPPNACILAVGAAVKKPVVEGDEIIVGHEMQMTMSSDHRIVDGAMAAAYLNTVKGMLENPATLLV